VEYVNLGSTGLRVSRVCLGMMSFGAHESRRWALPEEEAEPIVRRAVEGGITFFDTADVYNGGQSEVVTGRVLPKLLTREEMVVATKVCMQTMPGENGRGLSRKHVMASIDASLGPIPANVQDLFPAWNDPTTWNLAAISPLATCAAGWSKRQHASRRSPNWMWPAWRWTLPNQFHPVAVSTA